MDLLGWVSEHQDEIVQRFGEHVQLTALAVAIGFVISFPLGVLAYRYRRRLYAPITGVTGLLYTIPSLALFAALVPYTGLSFVTAEIGLVSYTLLILIRNIVTGLESVPEDAREAARGMGYSNRQLLWRVELPLALPVIVAGIRIATVTTIGLVTVTALITFGGFGAFILEGLRAYGNNNEASVMGALLSIMLAVIADAILIIGQKLLTPWSRRTAGRET